MPILTQNYHESHCVLQNKDVQWLPTKIGYSRYVGPNHECGISCTRHGTDAQARPRNVVRKRSWALPSGAAGFGAEPHIKGGIVFEV